MKEQKQKVALIHDFLVQEGGAEKVLSVLADMFPEAPIYTIVADFQRAGSKYPKKRIITSFIQKLPNGIKRYQWYLPLMPVAIESFDLSEYDLVISSASAFAKGVLTQPHTIHLCYCHSPTRYLWTDTHSYIRDLPMPRIIKKLIPIQLSKLRLWDYEAAQRPDMFIANSTNVSKRIKKYYGRDSQVLYPPIDTNAFHSSNETSDFFLAGGRIVGYKRFDILIEAFNHLGIPLKIFGTGPLENELATKAKKNITFLGMVHDEELKRLYSRAIAYINPQEEDCGLTMIEALSSGCPVIAYKAGGACEIVRDGENGTFFDEQTWEALADAVVRLREKRFSKQAVTQSAEMFSIHTFKEKLKTIVSNYDKNDAAYSN